MLKQTKHCSVKLSRSDNNVTNKIDCERTIRMILPNKTGRF